jgi:chemotaxis protein MotB
MTLQRTPRRRRSRRVEGSGEERDRWLISYADLVTLLFALFVVLFAAADKDRARGIAQALAFQIGETEGSGPAVENDGGSGILPEADSLAAEQTAIDKTFAGNPSLGQVARVTRTEQGLVVSLAEAGFFAPGEAGLRDDALVLLDALADALLESSAPLRIEGHTDSTPISNSRYPSNWELSSGRASTVLARLRARRIPSSRMSVAGYADERPISDNTTAEGRALNRRVDLVILSRKN